MDGKRTGEVETDPGPEVPQPARFALLRHDWPQPHRDLILEWPVERGGEQLSTWALYPENPVEEAFPADRPTAGRAVPLPPHRALYLHYEGPVAGNRGHVSRECAGVVVRAERGASLLIELQMERADGLVEGTFRIRQAKPGEKSLAIAVSHRHEGPAVSCMVFEWEPSGSPGHVQEGGEADSQGR